MRNYYKILSLLIMVLALSACGSGATSGDPLGTDTISVAASPTSLGAGGSSVVTATVLHADGRAATGRSVSFVISPNNSGGSISVTDDGQYSGIATAVYTAGATPSTGSIQDTVIARIENGASAVAIITRNTVPTNVVSLTTSCGGTVVAASSCIITATVKNTAGVAMSGINVSFDIPAKGTGAPTLFPLPVAPATTTIVPTDGNGEAKAVYTAGTIAGKTDWITAAITGGDAVIFITD